MQAFFWLSNLQRIVFYIVNDVLHRELNLHNVFVFGQHFRIVRMRTHSRGIVNNHLIYNWRVPTQTGHDNRFLDLTKSKHNAAFLFIQCVNAHKAITNDEHPQHNRNQGRFQATPTSRGPASAASAAEHAA